MAKEQQAASITRSVPEFVHERLNAKRGNMERMKRYTAWCHLPETIEMIGLLKDVFCRPVVGPVQPNDAVWYLGYNSGAWDVLETMVELKPDVPVAPDPEQDYTGDDTLETKSK